MTTYEVEQKFRVDDLNSIERQLQLHAAVLGPWEDHVDTYFAHPQRDFAVTDEAFRLRRIGDSNCITYKGPKLDKSTKTRCEIEIGIEPGSAAATDLRELVIKLGFRAVADVRKRRRSAPILWEQSAMTVSLDQVDRVGSFVEIETLASEVDLELARRQVETLSKSLGLHFVERRSYLELFLFGGLATF